MEERNLPYKSNKNINIYSPLGTHSKKDRISNDFYSTDPIAVDYLLKYETFDHNIWECACGNGNISKRLEEYGYNVLSTDLVYRGYGRGKIDFLKQTRRFNGDIITNPPYQYAMEFVIKALELSKQKVAMFLKIQFLESKKRYVQLFKENPPNYIYVFVDRISCYPNDVRIVTRSAVCYCWFVWDKQKICKEPVVRWMNNIED